MIPSSGSFATRKKGTRDKDTFKLKLFKWETRERQGFSFKNRLADQIKEEKLKTFKKKKANDK